MIVKIERYYIKKLTVGAQKRRRTSFWLFGIIPLYIKNEFVSGDCDVK